MIINDDKVVKFIDRLNEFVEELREHRSLLVHDRISEFYYMQKITEIQLLKESLESRYREVYSQWRKDARWLNAHLCHGDDTLN